MSYRGGRRRISGYHKLLTITTQVQSATGFRPVRKYTLDYDQAAEDCEGAKTPMRFTNAAAPIRGELFNLIQQGRVILTRF